MFDILCQLPQESLSGVPRPNLTFPIIAFGWTTFMLQDVVQVCSSLLSAGTRTISVAHQMNKINLNVKMVNKYSVIKKCHHLCKKRGHFKLYKKCGTPGTSHRPSHCSTLHTCFFLYIGDSCSPRCKTFRRHPFMNYYPTCLTQCFLRLCPVSPPQPAVLRNYCIQLFNFVLVENSMFLQ